MPAAKKSWEQLVLVLRFSRRKEGGQEGLHTAAYGLHAQGSEYGSAHQCHIDVFWMNLVQTWTEKRNNALSINFPHKYDQNSKDALLSLVKIFGP